MLLVNQIMAVLMLVVFAVIVLMAIGLSYKFVPPFKRFFDRMVNGEI